MRRDRKVVVISGASSGIGLAVVKQLSSMGHLVYAGARRTEDISKLSAFDSTQGIKLDITHPEDIDSLAGEIESTIGSIDVLINNAGVPGWGAIMDREIDYFKRIMEVNLFGHVQMVKAFYPLLQRSTSSPVIINISSQAGNYAFPFWAPYHMSKWALEAFSDCLRRELLGLGIRVVVIQPGAIQSSAFVGQRNAFAAYKAKRASAFHSRAIAMLQKAFERPSNRAREPEVVVDAITHAIHSKKSKRYYTPGRRLMPDILASALPRRFVDWMFLSMGAKDA